MYLNLPKWFSFPIVIPSLLEYVVIYCNIYTKLEVYSLKDYEAIFLKRQNLIFSIVTGSI